MQTHQLYILLSLLLITFTISSTAAATGELPPKPLLGGYTPIKNISDPHVIDVSKFAVKQHNKEDPAHKLRLLNIIKGYSQVVAGTNWKLFFYAKAVHSHGRRLYVAVVFEQPWVHSMNLTYFKPA
ncbi:hypothetical protein RND81_06G141100 [Saponaria officinalis]|uniref:Cystatin domain-containing protein n=1 Tax=Saponaria officinalis TaxID=3572 RepID=A0AAW1K9W7_SAPOF